MNRTLRFIATMIISSLALLAYGQDLHVFVVEAQSGDSIPFANAIYKGLNGIAATADANGALTIARKKAQHSTSVP